MTRWYLKVPVLSALALTLVMWGCDTASESALVGPGERSDVLHAGTAYNGYTVAFENDISVGFVSAVIGQAGGALAIGQHHLSVPAGAVTGPTLFTMTRVNDKNLQVDLTATRALPNDVGRVGFRVPLKLTVNYRSIRIPDPTQLKVVWIKPDGTTVPQETEVDTKGKFVIGSLNHFSAYALQWPDSGDDY